MKKCPFCGANIEESAHFCLYCMTSLEKKEKITLSKNINKRWLYIGISAALVLLILFICLLLFSTDHNKSNANNSSVSNISSEDNQSKNSSISSQSGIDNSSKPNSQNANNSIHQNNPTHQSSTTSQPDNTSSDEHFIGFGSISRNPTYSAAGSNQASSGSANNKNSSVVSVNKVTSSNNSNKTSSANSANTTTNSSSNKTPSSTSSQNTIHSNPATNSSNTGGSSSNIVTSEQSSSNDSEPSNAPLAVTYTYVTATLENAYPPGQGMYAPENAIVITGVTNASPDGVYVIPEKIDGKKVAAIMPSAFCDAKISGGVKSITLPATVRTIWSGAFSECYNLTDIYIKSNVIEIYKDALPSIYNRNATLMLYCSHDCRNFNFYYYRNIAENLDCKYQEWNG